MRLLTAAAALLLVVLVALSLAGIERRAITGGSMGDAIPAGSLTFSRSAAVADVRIGDVVAFRPEGHGGMVTHRVVGADARGLITRGDANRDADPWRLGDDARVERVAFHVPVAGRAVLAVQALPLTGLALLAGGLLLALLAARTPRGRAEVRA